MKKTIAVLLVALAALAFVGCDGAMHNTPAAYVTFEVVNFPVADGTYDVRGSFFKDGWSDAGVRQFDIAGGAGSYTTSSMIISSPISFSICEIDSWNRPFYPATTGNQDDFGKMQNFKYDVPMDGGTHNITIDGSTSPATVTVE